MTRTSERPTEPAQQQARAMRLATSATIATADALWWIADRLDGAGSRLMRTADRVSDAGHGVLSGWAQLAERIEQR